MNLRPWSQWTLDGRAEPGTDEVLATLRQVFKLDSRHPQALHLWIHAVEASPDPEQGLAEADRLILGLKLTERRGRRCSEWVDNPFTRSCKIVRMEESHLKFSEDHLWVLEMGQTARVGLSEYAQEQLGEIVSITTAEIGKFLERGDAIGELESQKTVVELLSPITGTIRAVNENVVEDPSLINVDPYGKGWLAEVEVDEPEELLHLMGADEYEAFVED